MKISIAYAVPGRQVLQSHNVPDGATIREAIEASGILEQLPQVDLNKNKVGVWGKAKPLDTVLSAGDRVEIYFPITIDPKSVPKKKPAEKPAAAEQPAKAE